MIGVLLALLLLLPRSVGSEEITTPEPPAGQVLDASQWLDSASTRRLESELGRLRREHQVDVCLVVWEQPLPGNHDPESFAHHLGTTWERENLWAIVLQEPGSDRPPAVACQGDALAHLGTDTTAPSIESAIAQGMKDWTDRSRATRVALNLGEELVYLQLRHQQADDAMGQPLSATAVATRQMQNARTIRMSLAVAAVILVIGVLITIRIVRHRGPGELVFPDTRWRRRLGASWCGGSDLVTTFTPPDPQ